MISFWQFLSESNFPLTKKLIKVFGSKIVFSDEPMEISIEALQEMYKALDTSLFAGQVKNIPPIWYASNQTIVKEIARRDPESSPPSNKFLGITLMSEMHKDVYSITNPKDYVFGDYCIALNATYLGEPSFAFVLATLCHEMIHYCDALYGDDFKVEQYKKIMYKMKDTKDHSTKIFRTKMRDARNMNIDVIEFWDKNKSATQLDQEATEMWLDQKQNEEQSKKMIQELESNGGEMTLENGIHVKRGKPTSLWVI